MDPDCSGGPWTGAQCFLVTRRYIDKLEDWYESLKSEVCCLIKNKTQTAVINILNLHILIMT